MSSRWTVVAVLAVTVLVCLGLLSVFSDRDRTSLTNAGDWGIDACLTGVPDVAEVPGYLSLLHTSGIRWLRERAVGVPDGPALDTPQRRVWAAERRAGYRVVAFASWFQELKPEDPDNQLPEDLLAVYERARGTSAAIGNEVSAWEMVGEPEAFYCRDLPDRVAAYQKAIYLGLKDGSPSVGVLTGALAFPPGPWLEDAAANGIFDYTDALNVHHYGFAKEFGNLIAVHRLAAARWVKDRVLPIWVTEVGLNNVPYADPENTEARRAQARYLISCARQASEQGVAVFMPFILSYRGDPFSMTRDAKNPYPSWNAYREFTLRNHLARTPCLAPPQNPGRIVLQWMPDDLTCVPDKISRTYWFKEDEGGSWQPIEGQLRIYNLGSQPASVDLQRVEPGNIPGFSILINRNGSGVASLKIEVPALGCVRLPLSITWKGAFVRAKLQYVAKPQGAQTLESGLTFSVGTRPRVAMARAEKFLTFRSPVAVRGEGFSYISGSAPFVTTGSNAEWLGINGVSPRSAHDSTGEFVFDVEDRSADPLSPPMAIARLPRGLPEFRNGYLRLRATDETGRPAFIRMDLVDDRGERFTILENYGRNPFVGTSDTILLGYANFHPWVFGKYAADAKFEPGRVREMQLRFSDVSSPRRIHVQLSDFDFLNPSY